MFNMKRPKDIVPNARIADSSIAVTTSIAIQVHEIPIGSKKAYANHNPKTPMVLVTKAHVKVTGRLERFRLETMQQVRCCEN